MILFKILKLFGLDVPAKIAAAKADLELRVEQATDHVKQVAGEAAVIAALSAIAAVAAAMAIGVGLTALYLWTASAYGPYAGLGVVGAILIVVMVIFATAATIKSKSLAANRTGWPRHPAGIADATSDSGAIMRDSVDAVPTGPHSGAYAWAPQTAAAPVVPTASASDLVEPLALFLSKFVKYPSIDNPVVNELIGSLRATAHGTADDAINRAANVIRHGDRTNLFVILTGAALVGWLLAHNSQRLTR